jgi:glycosyltransferase involved in cell wall biosynthesis
MKRRPERIFLTWLPFSSRSQTLAENFHAEAVYFRYLADKHNALKALLRYLIMTLHTCFLVVRYRPRLVFVMNQPVFLPLTLFLLSRFLKVQYVIDSHSGLFNKARWKWALPMMKYAYRHSLFSIVTNEEHQRLVESWGAQVEVLGALTVGSEPVEPFARPKQPCLAVIGTFAEDEPTAEILAAARQLPEVAFFVTGSLKHAPAELVENAPENVTFTDFQPRPKYVGLVQAMDGALILVKKDQVMQRGAYEAMSWSVPIITSDWRILRENFYRGALFTDNSPESIVKCIRELFDNLEFYRTEIQKLRSEKKESWDHHITRINAFIAERL